MNNQKTLENTKILIVDDDTYSLELMEYVLKSHGATVFSFSNAKDALEKLVKIKPEILISDIGMADMDGLDLIGEVRKTFIKKELPAIAMTAFASLEDRDKVISAGFQLHYPKPIDIDDLPKTIKNLLRGKV